MSYNQQLVQKFSQLPEDLKEALLNVPIAEKIEVIRKKYDLHVDDAGYLEDAVESVILGVLHPRDFMDRVTSFIRIPADKAALVVKDINTEIFLPVRKALQHIHELSENDSIMQLTTEGSAAEIHPSSAEILGAISNPESIPKVTRIVSPMGTVDTVQQATTQNAAPTPQVVAQTTPETTSAAATVAPPQTQSIHEEKLTSVVQTPQAQKEILQVNRAPIIPTDVKAKINKDPYREQIP